jgi:hypothetical protein
MIPAWLCEALLDFAQNCIVKVFQLLILNEGGVFTKSSNPSKSTTRGQLFIYASALPPLPCPLGPTASNRPSKLESKPSPKL